MRSSSAKTGKARGSEVRRNLNAASAMRRAGAGISTHIHHLKKHTLNEMYIFGAVLVPALGEEQKGVTLDSRGAPLKRLGC